MDVFLRTDINFAAMIMLGIVCMITYRKLDLKDHLNKVFLITSLVVILELFFEAATCILNRRPEPWAAPLSVILHLFLYSTAPILTFFWYLMISHWIFTEERTSRRKHAILLIPAAVNLIVTLLSPTYGLIFYIDNANVYHRGPFYPFVIAILYFYFLYTLILILKQRKKIVREELFPLLVAGTLPMIGGLLQALFYGILLMWSCSGFSLVIVYIFLQQRMVHLDALTGAWTRGTFEYHIMQKVRQKEDDVFGLILLDIDRLKQINDEYGHLEGDYALKTVVRLVKSVLGNTDVIARTGGDEFIIILDGKSRDRLEQTIEKIKDALHQHNETVNKGYMLDCSIGAELYRPSFEDIDQFMHHVDILMYENKRNKDSASQESNSSVSLNTYDLNEEERR